MNKSELVAFVSRDLGTSRVKAEVVVAAVLSGIRRGLTRDRGVSLVGFGSFAVRRRKARIGRNPKTGEAIPIRAGRSVAFRAGRALKAAL